MQDIKNINMNIKFCKTFAYFSVRRLWAVIIKEFIQLRRDRLTFAMIIAVPLMQLILFGYAINTNPKNMPTVIVSSDYSVFTRTFINGLKNTEYFDVTKEVKGEADAKKLLENWDAQFVISIPQNFTKNLLRGTRPQILIEADATDPVATSSALAAILLMSRNIFDPLFTSPISDLKFVSPAIDLVTHAVYNPESITRYNIVPGLLGVVLVMTLSFIASSCITKEREKGTMEHLLSTPVRPLEVMMGKIAPFFIVGYIQVTLILLISRFLFQVPIYGSVTLLLVLLLPFMAANLSVGLTFSSLAKSQLQATQMSTFYFLPSFLLSGFMFPFRGMPLWAQYVGNLLPLTHFLRIARGIVLKGNGFALLWSDIWPIILFMVVAMLIGVGRYRQTLD